MRWLPALTVVLALALRAGAAATEDSPHPARLLFVGNSITYVGNLPAVLDALSARNGHPSASDMLASPGATLTDWVKTGAVRQALEATRYSFVVVQERGGDLMGGFGAQAREESEKALQGLAQEIRRHGATPILLGTYQPLPESSRRIEETEGEAARAVRIVYLPVSERLRRAGTTHSDMAWFASDGMHPGPDLTLLYALLLYRTIHGLDAAAAGFSVQAPIFSYRDSGLEPQLRSAVAAAPRSDTLFGVTYTATRVAAVRSAL
jgi:hypothetical protein